MKRLAGLYACQRLTTDSRTAGLYGASRWVLTNKADRGRQLRFSTTRSPKNTLRVSSFPPRPCVTRSCRPCSPLENPIYEVSFAEFLAEAAEDDEMGDANSATSNASSGKRKRTAGPAFYAVKVGRAPGIYYSWRDCEAQIKGVKAECRSLYTLAGTRLTES